MKIDEIIAFIGSRSPKRQTIKKKVAKDDDSLSQKVQDRLKQYRTTGSMTKDKK